MRNCRLTAAGNLHTLHVADSVIKQRRTTHVALPRRRNATSETRHEQCTRRQQSAAILSILLPRQPHHSPGVHGDARGLRRTAITDSSGRNGSIFAGVEHRHPQLTFRYGDLHHINAPELHKSRSYLRHGECFRRHRVTSTQM